MTQEPKKRCDCWEKVNDALKKEGLCLPFSIAINTKTQIFDTAQSFFIAVERHDARSRKRIPKISCNFCPICGEEQR